MFALLAACYFVPQVYMCTDHQLLYPWVIRVLSVDLSVQLEKNKLFNILKAVQVINYWSIQIDN